DLASMTGDAAASLTAERRSAPSTSENCANESGRHQPAGTADRATTSLHDRLRIGHSARSVGGGMSAQTGPKDHLKATRKPTQPVHSSQTRPENTQHQYSLPARRLSHESDFAGRAHNIWDAVTRCHRTCCGVARPDSIRATSSSGALLRTAERARMTGDEEHPLTPA